ncbi:IS66 family insertion sequence element accessory protein TnpB [Turicimonas muris]|uniref:IS66 family insertion sequence element accessory protein TnpB n=1 Tax=Turicimonas muris TaxID=1796652 RepID=UPI0013034CA7|nr:IS66 family insertion sequence element accessory protein TnpB [Turicimonas muris]
MRCGCSRFCAIAQEKLNINIYRGGDIVLFISKSSAICKLVCADAKGTSMLTRTLLAGRFEKML